MSFQDLGLSPEILRAVTEQGYSEPTQIQREAIPVALKRMHIMGLAPTGTGKTLAFTVPILQLLSANNTAANSGRRMIRSLILTPTRELAAQVAESVRAYGKHLNLRSEVIFGGVNINPQIDKLRRGTDIVIATPGRLLDLINQRVVDLSKVEILVLDEADRMLDMGFIHDVKKIIALLPRAKQCMLFSATLSGEIQGIADSLLVNPKIIEIAKRNVTTTLVDQVVYPVDKGRKRELLSFMIGSRNWKQVLVFTRTKHGANKLCEQLAEDGLSAAAIHGNKSQGARTRALAEFKSGKVRVLVATDIAARGIDIDNLPYVVNFDLPNVPEDYVHRIGRTGRAGNTGMAVSLVCIDEHPLLKDIERVTKKTIAQVVVAGYEPDRSIKAEPKARPQQRRPEQRRQAPAGGNRGFAKDKDSGSRWQGRR
jgi:ATP-dependent RNA helicase RhlE